jgi:hypothetical protein
MTDSVAPRPGSAPNWLSERQIMTGVPLGGVLVWWIHRQSAAVPGVEHPILVWIVVGLACVYVTAGLLAAVECVLQPARVAVARGRRMASRGPVVIVLALGSLVVFLTAELTMWPPVAAGVLGLLALAVVRSMRVRIPISKPSPTPMHPDPAPALAAPAPGDVTWDVFLSYRVTPNANVVRRFAESLVRQGYRPWFAEYEISPNEWNDKTAIAAKLADGVAHSRYFLVFTNDAWTASAWCNEEMRAILGRGEALAAAGRIGSLAEVLAEIRLPPSPAPHAVFAPLASVRQCVIEDDILEVWDFLERDLGWAITRRHDEATLLNAERALANTPPAAIAGGLTFASAGLLEREDIFDPGFGARGWEFASYFGTWMGQEVKLRVLVNPFAGTLNVPVGIPGVSDDRALHRQFVAAFSAFLKTDDRVTALGTHLVHLADGHSGLAVSWLRTSESGRGVLTRVFDIPLQRPLACRSCGRPVWFSTPGTGDGAGPDEVIAACDNPDCTHAESWPRWRHDTVGEVEFSFVLVPREPTAQGCQRQLAELAPFMEAVARSVRRRWWADLVEWQSVAVRLLMLGVALEGYRYCAVSLAARWCLAAWLTAAGFAAAELLFALGLPGERRGLLRTLYGRKMKLPMGTWFPRWWNVGKSAVLHSLWTGFVGLWPMGLAAAAGVGFLPVQHLTMAAALGAATAIAGMASRPGIERGAPPGEREVS